LIEIKKFIFREGKPKMTNRTEAIKTSQHTNITHEVPFQFNAPHHFEVVDNEDNLIQLISFQEGPINEAGVNGVTNEDLLTMVVLRLEGFQNSDFACDENESALGFVRLALDALESRTAKRLARGVEGTHVV
jgi:hypothetical protein